MSKRYVVYNMWTLTKFNVENFTKNMYLVFLQTVPEIVLMYVDISRFRGCGCDLFFFQYCGSNVEYVENVFFSL